MKKSLLIIAAVIFGFSANAQVWEDFENWTQNNVLSLDDYQTPVDERGVEGASAAYRVADPVTGSYSLKLETVISPTNGDTIFGYFLSGDVDNSVPGQPVTLASPGVIDSIVGWYKYDIVAGDSAAILLETYNSSSPSGGGTYYFKGQQTTWKRFSYYVGTTMSDSILIAAATGDPLNNFNGIAGSWVQFDDIQLKGPAGTMNILNYSFENWTADAWEDPNGWFTLNSWALGEPVFPAVKTTNAYAGSYAIQLNTLLSTMGDTLWGATTNGTFGDNGPEGGVPFSGTPTRVECYYNYYPISSDTGRIAFEFRQNGSVVATSGNNFTTTVTSYTLWSSASLPAVTPDTVLITLWAGNNPGSVLRVDNIDIVFPVGISEGLTVEKLVAYPNPATDVLRIKFDIENDNDVSIKLIDALGKELTTRSLGHLSSGTYRESFNTSNFSSGVYFLEFSLDGEKTVKRFIIE